MNKSKLVIKSMLMSLCLLALPENGFSQGIGYFNEPDSVTVLSGQKVKFHHFNLTKENERYAKYYFPEMTKPNQELINIISKGPFDYKKGQRNKDINALLDPGYMEIETGYTLFPDSTGIICGLTVMPGVSANMIDWWFGWHPLEAARYMLWNPKVHLDAKLSDKDRKRLTDRNLSNKERFWTTTHIVTEDVGLGMFPLNITFMSPEEFGFDMTKFKEPNVSTAICARISGGGVNGRFVHFVRNVSGGVEMRSRFYFDKGVPIELLKGLNFHCIEEYTHLAKILPAIYKDFKNE